METESAAADPATSNEAADGPAAGGGFWTSLPGVLTGCTALIAALSGLVTGLNHAGVLGTRKADAHVVPTPAPNADPSPAPSPTPAPTSAPTPTPPVVEGGALRTYYVASPGDGFSFVRKGPTKDSASVTALESGTRVRCRAGIPDPDPETGRTWHFCPAEGGYISAKLLRETRPAS